MKTSVSWKLRSLGGKVLAGLVFAAMLCSMDVAPASAEGRNDRGVSHNARGGRHDNGRYDHRGRGYDRGHYRGGRGYGSYGYVEPVYVAPPVYYAPVPAPGVSIFLPTIHIR
jgi:uncharacterized membrane protein